METSGPLLATATPSVCAASCPLLRYMANRDALISPPYRPPATSRRQLKRHFFCSFPLLYRPRGPPISLRTISILLQLSAWDSALSRFLSSLSLASRYADAMDRLPLPYPESAATLEPEARFSRLNEYLLDGFLYADQPCTSVNKHALSRERIKSLATSQSWGAISEQISLAAFRMRASQQYLDGNHRTSVLYMYEICFDFGRTLEVDPLLLYGLLSCRDYAVGPREAISSLSRVLCTASSLDKVPLSRRIRTAALVKELPVRVSFYFNFIRALRSSRSDLCVKRLRELKRTNLTEYHVFRSVFSQEIGCLFSKLQVHDKGEAKKKFMKECSDMNLIFVPSED